MQRRIQSRTQNPMADPINLRHIRNRSCSRLHYHFQNHDLFDLATRANKLFRGCRAVNINKGVIDVYGRMRIAIRTVM
jgi:hypothetical protein